MNLLYRTILIAALLFIPALGHAELNGLARISLVEGNVQFHGGDTPDWLPVAVNTPLDEGDSIWCPPGSRAEIQLRNGTCIRLDENSSLDLIAVEDDFAQVHLGMGHLYARTTNGREQSLQLDTADTTVKIYARTRLQLDLNDEGDTDVSIIRGTAYVEGNGSRTRLRAGEMLTADGNRSEIFPLAPPDAWARWNMERDRIVYARLGDRRYLPDQLAIYADDLAGNGEWLQVRDYGYVWRPTVIVPDWAPYQVGRWVWRGGDYVWISAESWGWAPYHYGRWVVVPGSGWCWVPPARDDVFWGPGYVGWVTTPTYVGWVPLAPGETYYGYGRYGRHSVNITNVNINITSNRIAYRNTTINNAVTVVKRESFIAGRMSYVTPRSDLFNRKGGFGPRPRLRPEAPQAMMPALKRIPAVQRPPAAVERVERRTLRQHYPRIVEGPAPATAIPAPIAGPKGLNGNGRHTPARPTVPTVRYGDGERIERPAQPQTTRPQTLPQPQPAQPLPPRRQPATPVVHPPAGRTEDSRPAEKRDGNGKGYAAPHQGEQPRGNGTTAPVVRPEARQQPAKRPAAAGEKAPRRVWRFKDKEQQQEEKKGKEN